MAEGVGVGTLVTIILSLVGLITTLMGVIWGIVRYLYKRTISQIERLRRRIIHLERHTNCSPPEDIDE